MISFIILNYKNYKDTIVCVDSILKINHPIDYSIIIVDNDSKNESVNVLKEKYKNNNKIDIIETNENLGFANGNNYGARYAKQKYNPDFMYVLNNDTEIIDSDTINKVLESYNNTNFDVYAPQVYDYYTGTLGNPISVVNNIDEARLNLKRNIFSRKLLKFGVLAHRASDKIFDLFHRKPSSSGVGLCGCALLFSRKYIERYKNIFVDSTFLYGEEAFLQYRRNKDGLIFILDESTKINHIHGASTGFSKKNYFFKVNNKIASGEKLLEAYENNLEV